MINLKKRKPTTQVLLRMLKGSRDNNMYSERNGLVDIAKNYVKSFGVGCAVPVFAASALRWGREHCADFDEFKLRLSDLSTNFLSKSASTYSGVIAGLYASGYSLAEIINSDYVQKEIGFGILATTHTLSWIYEQARKKYISDEKKMIEEDEEKEQLLRSKEARKKYQLPAKVEEKQKGKVLTEEDIREWASIDEVNAKKTEEERKKQNLNNYNHNGAPVPNNGDLVTVGIK